MSIKNERNYKQKILCIAPLPPPVHGSAMMTQYIKDSAVINGAFNLDWINLSTSRSMDEIGKKSISKIVRFLGAYLKTIWRLLTNRYDACYIALTCHGIGFLKDAPFALMCKLFVHKLIIHQHNKGMSADINNPFFKKLFSMVYKDSSVILLSWKLYPDIEKIVKKSQIYICPNGIPDNLKDEAFEKTEGKTKFLFLSNLLVEKGVYILLESLRILHDKKIDFECDFVGGETFEIKEADLKQKIIENNLEKKVIYHGAKYGEEKEQYWKNVDAFVLPTLNECYPLVLLEAMQHGITCIASDEGAISDIIDNNKTGLIFRKGDSKTLASHLAFLIKNKEICKKMGRQGMHKYRTSMTIADFEKNIFECFQNVLND